ncbi:hypothetical protein D5S17_35240 [Pseudonocardiaceae bacterium YIM PH 21723]|nr:hypothetical protein D5S17_35240 [Pseudonocardiaceae bacterium YIM PH 21723]
MSTFDTTAALLKVIAGLSGLRVCPPAIAGAASWVADLDGLAIDLEPGLVEVRLVAMALPLPPLLTAAGTALRTALAGTEWADAQLRLVVAALDEVAFTGQ